MTTPFQANMNLYLNTGRVVYQLEYVRVIGCLMNATTCILDIAFVVGKMSIYTSNPSHILWNVVHKF